MYTCTFNLFNDDKTAQQCEELSVFNISVSAGDVTVESDVTYAVVENQWKKKGRFY